MKVREVLAALAAGVVLGAASLMVAGVLGFGFGLVAAKRRTSHTRYSRREERRGVVRETATEARSPRAFECPECGYPNAAGDEGCVLCGEPLAPAVSSGGGRGETEGGAS